MSETRIPRFSHKRFNQLPQDKRKEFVDSYKAWLQNPFTTEMFNYLERELDLSYKEDEEKTSFLTRFQFKFHSAYYRGKRAALRLVIKLVRD